MLRLFISLKVKTTGEGNVFEMKEYLAGINIPSTKFTHFLPFLRLLADVKTLNKVNLPVVDQPKDNMLFKKLLKIKY